MYWLPVSMIWCLLVSQTTAQATQWHFREWYPGQDWLEDIARLHCSDFMNLYLTQNDSCTYAWTLGDGLSWGNIVQGVPTWPHCVQLHHVVDCILTNTDESGKAFLATASVLVGLLPTILGLAGSSTAEIGLLAQRRPFLALLLSVAAPVLNPIRQHQYREPVSTLLLEVEGTLELPKPKQSIWKYVVSLLQYLLMIGAGANLVTALRDLTARTVLGASAQFFWLPGLWALVGTLLHIAGAFTFRLRYKVKRRGKQTWRNDELMPCMYQTDAELYLFSESYGFVICAWMISVLTFLHILFGTAIFSSILLLPLGEASQFAVRLLLCTVSSRAILMLEISSMKKTLKVQPGVRKRGKTV